MYRYVRSSSKHIFMTKKSYFFLKSFWVLAITNFSLIINQLGNNLGKEGKANNTVNFHAHHLCCLVRREFCPPLSGGVSAACVCVSLLEYVDQSEQRNGTYDLQQDIIS